MDFKTKAERSSRRKEIKVGSWKNDHSREIKIQVKEISWSSFEDFEAKA